MDETHNSLKRTSRQSESLLGEPPLNRPKLRLAAIRLDDMDDDDHHRLDKEVMLDVHHIDTSAPLSDSQLLLVLLAVVENSNGVLDAQYSRQRNASALLAAREELRQMLRNAWRDKRFMEVRKLGAQPMFSVPSSRDVILDPEILRAPSLTKPTRHHNIKYPLRTESRRKSCALFYGAVALADLPLQSKVLLIFLLIEPSLN